MTNPAADAVDQPAEPDATQVEPDMEGADDEASPVEQRPIDVEHEEVPPPETALVTLAQAPMPTREPHERLVPGLNLQIVPPENELAALGQLAVTLSAAKALPEALQDKPNDVLLILLTARDLGVSLTTAIREFHIINGKVTTSPKVRLAMVRQQGHGLVWPHGPQVKDGELKACVCGEDGKNDGVVATWHAMRHDMPGVLHSSTYTQDMASRVAAKEHGRNIKLNEKSTWKSYPERMLSWRALGYLLDDVFPEVGTGLYSPDEMGAVTDEEGNPVIDVTGGEPLAGHRAPRGRQSQQAREAAAEQNALLSDSEREALRARIYALPDAARAELLRLWTEVPEGSEHPRLRALDHMLARELKVADALIKSIEARAAKGEWGEWSPPEPDGDDGGAESPAEGDEDEGGEAGDSEPVDQPPAAPAGEAGHDEPGDGEADQGELEQPAEVPLVDRIVAVMQRMDKAALVAELGIRAKATSGNLDTLRRRLGELLLDEGDKVVAALEQTYPPKTAQAQLA